MAATKTTRKKKPAVDFETKVVGKVQAKSRYYYNGNDHGSFVNTTLTFEVDGNDVLVQWDDGCETQIAIPKDTLAKFAAAVNKKVKVVAE